MANNRPPPTVIEARFVLPGSELHQSMVDFANGGSFSSVISYQDDFLFFFLCVFLANKIAIQVNLGFCSWSMQVPSPTFVCLLFNTSTLLRAHASCSSAGDPFIQHVPPRFEAIGSQTFLDWFEGPQGSSSACSFNLSRDAATFQPRPPEG